MRGGKDQFGLCERERRKKTRRDEPVRRRRGTLTVRGLLMRWFGELSEVGGGEGGDDLEDGLVGTGG